MERQGSEGEEAELLICMTYIYQYCYPSFAWSFITYVSINDLPGVCQELSFEK